MLLFFLSRVTRSPLGLGHFIFAGIFLLLFIAAMYWAFRKDGRINRMHFGNTGMLALVIGGGILLMILVKILLRNL